MKNIFIVLAFVVYLHHNLNHINTHTTMKAKINTKSNYRNLNGLWLNVKEIEGKRVTCTVYLAEFNKKMDVDFLLSEISEMKFNSQVSLSKQYLESL